MERGAVGLGACFAAIDTIVTIYFWGYDTRQMTAIYMPTLGNGKSKGSGWRRKCRQKSHNKRNIPTYEGFA